MLGRCGDCEDKWRLFLAAELKTNNMKNSEEKKEVEGGDKAPIATPQAQVAASKRVDVNKVIEDRRKTVDGGKTIKK